MPDVAPAAPPIANTLLIADQILRDGASGKWIIVGVFNSIRTGAVPTVHPRLDVFFQVTNVGGPVDLRLRIEHADDGDVILEIGGDIESDNPLKVLEKSISLKGLTFPREGKHWVQLVSNEEILTQAPLFVIVVEEDHDAGDLDQDDE